MYVTNILHWYALATPEIIADAERWYHDAHELAKRHPLGVECGAAVIAAFSINEGWAKNVRHFENDVNGIEPRCLPLAKKKAKQVSEAAYFGQFEAIPDILGGRKIVRFYHNILRPNETTFVTIDRHALRVAGEMNEKPSDKVFEAVEAAYMQAAQEVGILPHVLQAITWVTYRKVNGYEKQYG